MTSVLPKLEFSVIFPSKDELSLNGSLPPFFIDSFLLKSGADPALLKGGGGIFGKKA